jgi:hypothetical protein
MGNPGDIEVARIQKNSRESLIFALTTFKDHRLISMRSWVRTETGDEIPTKSGLSLRIDLLSDVQKALSQVELAAHDMGWLATSDNGGTP